MEDLLAALLRWGMLLSFGLVLTGLVLRMAFTHQLGLEEPLQGTNVFHLLLRDVSRAGSHRVCPSLLIRLGVSTLLLTPFVRVAASCYYFACVERNRTHTLLTLLTLLTLGYIIFLG